MGRGRFSPHRATRRIAAAPNFVEGLGAIGTPDAVLSRQQEFEVPASGKSSTEFRLADELHRGQGVEGDGLRTSAASVVITSSCTPVKRRPAAARRSVPQNPVAERRQPRRDAARASPARHSRRRTQAAQNRRTAYARSPDFESPRSPPAPPRWCFQPGTALQNQSRHHGDLRCTTRPTGRHEGSVAHRLHFREGAAAQEIMSSQFMNRAHTSGRGQQSALDSRDRVHAGLSYLGAHPAHAPARQELGVSG